MTKPRPVIITTQFKTSLRENYLYIKQFSISSADGFADEAYRLLPIIAKFPEAYPIEHRMPTKRNLYRFKKFKKNYKIVFKALKSKAVFLSVIYARRSDKKYGKIWSRDYT